MLPIYKGQKLKKEKIKKINRYWRSEPTNVEKLGDELWIGVKG